MDASETGSASTKPKRRFRFGLRGLIALILLVGLALGWFAQQDRLAREQTARLAELRRMGIVVNDPYPSNFCWTAMKFLGADSAATEARLSRWLDAGWFTRPRGFNAGILPDEKVGAIVERIGRFGSVKEVHFDRPPLAGLRLFYIDRVPYERLGVPREAVTVVDHSLDASKGKGESP